MYEKIKSAYINAFDEKDSFLNDILIINTKCLVDDKISRKVYIDYNRLKDEINFYKYCSLDNKNIKNCLNLILPIILSNVNLQISRVEVLKNIEFFFSKTENYYEYIICGVAYNNLFFSIIKKSDISLHEIINNIKAEIIDYSMDCFENKLDVIKFERCRINFIQKIDRLYDNKVQDFKEDNLLDAFLKTIYQIYVKDGEDIALEFKSIKNSIYGVLGLWTNQKLKQEEFIVSMSGYICKIRKYEIGKKPYKEEFDPRKLALLNIGDVYDTPILSKVKIEDKKISENIITIKISSKSGIYNLKFKKN